MQIIDVIQNSPEWQEIKLGVPSSSNFDKIVTVDGKPSKQKEKYMFKLAGEKVSGMITESYQNFAMQRGIEMEEEARQLYQLLNSVEIETVGFCLAEGYGCSPDGLVGQEGCIEIKCPLPATHVGYLLDNKLPTDYFQQVQGQLLVTGRKWVDFMSYAPGIKPLIIRVERDDKFLTTLKAELGLFCKQLSEIIEKIKI